MSDGSFFYTREFGPDGQILTDEGGGPGQPLSGLLPEGGLPIRAALELVASVADVLTIAEEDEVFHGDIKPGSISVDPSGHVSVNGYGVERRSGRAPEGKPVGVASDVYGLGVLMFATLSGKSMGAIPREAEAHDDAIVERLGVVDWGAIQDLSLIHI